MLGYSNLAIKVCSPVCKSKLTVLISGVISTYLFGAFGQ